MHFMTESAPSTRERRRTEITRTLVSLARRATAAGGLNGFTVDQLCDEAGVSRRTFFNYFASKEDAVLGIPLHTDRDETDEFFVAMRPRTPAGAVSATLLTDYAAHGFHGRYVGASLPLLPFFDREFDLVLCAHLLFVYAKRFDFDFHLAACRELVRVSRQEVRIHPIVGTNGRKYPELGRLRIALAEEGIDSEIVDVDYEFFAGSDSMLVLRRKNGS